MNMGLEGVIAAETVLSDVDGQRGQLTVRGHLLEELAGRASYEDTLSLLFAGFFEDLPDRAELQRALGAARLDMFAHLRHADRALIALDPMDGVRALVARIADGSRLGTAMHLIAAPAVFLAGLCRLRQRQDPVVPDPDLDHATDVLRMMALPASALQARALDAYLVTVADHGLNASTFAARVVASTGSGLVSSVLAALGALKGPLHGGAPGPVLDMLDEIGQPSRASDWVDAALQRGDRLMGFGHRIYRVRDPRADALQAALKSLPVAGDPGHQRLELAKAVEAVALEALRRAKPDRVIQTNVEFATALLLDGLGFERDTFTCVFAIGRVGGWIAHAREQTLTGRLIRPQSRYIGPRAA